MQPIPRDVFFQSPRLPRIYLKQVPDEQDIISVSVLFSGRAEFDNLEFETTVARSDFEGTSMDGVVQISILKPDGINAAGDFSVSIRFEMQTGPVKETSPIDFAFYDGGLARVVGSFQQQIPASGVIGGRKLDLRSTVQVVVANFPSTAMLEDISAFLSPSEQPADILFLEEKVSCKEGQEFDCSRHLLKLKTPALESPGEQQIEIKRGDESILTLVIEVVPPCSYDEFCQGLSLIPNLQKLLQNPALECSPDDCLDAALIGDPRVESFSPKYGSKSGGTEIVVDVRDLPAFSADDVVIQVKHSLGSIRVRPTSLHQKPTSTLISSSGTLGFVTPSLVSDDESATIEITVMVAGMRKTTSFEFEYLPVISGAPGVAYSSPSNIFAGQDLDFAVKLENFPRLSFPFSEEDVIVQLDGVDVPTGSIRILSSDRYATSLTFTAQSPTGSPAQVTLGSRSMGLGSVVTIDVLVDPVPDPLVKSSFPSSDEIVPPDIETQISVKVAHLPLSVSDWQVSAIMTFSSNPIPYQVQVEGSRNMDESCSDTYCSLYEFILMVPSLAQADQEQGGTGRLQITADSIAVELDLTFRAVGEPSVHQVVPKKLETSASMQDVQLYVRNFPSAGCKATSCVEEAMNAGLEIEFASLTSPANDYVAEDLNGLLVLTFQAPLSNKAGRVSGILQTSSGSPLSFEIEYKMPPATVGPMDGSVSGGQQVTISASGWWETGGSMPEIAKDDLTITFGETPLQESAIISVNQEDLELKVVIITPQSDKTGAIAGQVTWDGISSSVTSRFEFDYYQDPVVTSMEPHKATLRGKTAAEDGETVLVTIKDAPQRMSSASDVTISFGDVVCGPSSGCGIKSIRSSKQDGARYVYLSVRVPTWPMPEDVSVGVTAAAAPGRMTRSVSSRFTFYQPLPSALSARWCSSCATDARTCIVMGLCGDDSVPLRNLLPLSGGGTVTVLVRDPPANLAFKKVDGTSDDMLTLALGSSFGEFKRIAYGDGETDENSERTVQSTIVAIEFDIPELYSASAEQMEITLHPSGDLAPALATLAFKFFDNTIAMKCLEGCKSRAGGNEVAVVAITNFPMDLGAAATDQVFAMFGDFEATSVDFASHMNCSSQDTCLQIVSPACEACIFSRGSLELSLSVGLKADPTRGANAKFVYISAPSIARAMMDTVGSSINVLFDQDTDRGGMSSESTDCFFILDDVSGLGSSPLCVWEAADSLNVFLGIGTHLAPYTPPDVLLAFAFVEPSFPPQ